MPRNVSILILIDEENKILFQHRAKDAVRLPNFWAFFGGGIEKGETPEQALQRESLEELEYSPVNPKLVMVQVFYSNDVMNKKYVFLEKYDPNQSLIQHEGQAMEWFHLSETEKLKIVDHDRDVLQFIKKQI